MHGVIDYENDTKHNHDCGNGEGGRPAAVSSAILTGEPLFT
jgi:hypothetical protein